MDVLDKHIYRLLAGLVLLVLATGTIFYHLVEKFSLVNSYYFSVITLSTVGYGDLTPHTTAGKLFTTFYIFAGVGIIAAFISATARRRGAKIQKRHDHKH